MELRKPSIEAHFFTAGAGNAGKSTMLLGTLGWFVKTSKQNTWVVVIDASDNNDVFDLWLKPFAISPVASNKPTYHHYELHRDKEFYVTAVKPNSVPLTWELFSSIVCSLPVWQGAKSIQKVILLVDTGRSLHTLTQQLGQPKLSIDFDWILFPWFVWTPNALNNPDFYQETKSGFSALTPSAPASAQDQVWRLVEVLAFNPLLPNSDQEKQGLPTRLFQSKLPQIETIASYSNYALRDAKALLDRELFFSQAYTTFITKAALDDAPNAKEVHELIGRVLMQKNFRPDDSTCTKAPCRYANIVCIPYHDRNLASLKVVQYAYQRLSQNVISQASRNQTNPIVELSDFLGKVVKEAVPYNLTRLYSALS